MNFALAAVAAIGSLLSYTPSVWAVHTATAAVFAAAMIAASRQRCWMIPKAGCLLAGLAAFGALQVAAGLSVLPYATITETLRWAAAALLFVTAVSTYQELRRLTSFLQLFTTFAGAVAFYALIQPYAGRLGVPGLASMGADYMVGPFQNRNTYSAFAELALPVAAWLAARGRTALGWLAAAVILASAVGTGSRAGAALAFTEVLVFSVLSRRWMAGAVLGGVAALALAVSGDALHTRIGYTDPLVHRSDIYASTLKMIQARPLWGWGLGAYSDAYPQFATFDVGRVVNHAHNDLLEWAADGGVPFALAAAGFFTLSVRGVRRNLWAMGLPTVLIHSLVDYPFQGWGVTAWFLLLSAGLAAKMSHARGLGGPPSRGKIYRAGVAASRFQRSQARALPTSSTRRFSTSP